MYDSLVSPKWVCNLHDNDQFVNFNELIIFPSTLKYDLLDDSQIGIMSDAQLSVYCILLLAIKLYSHKFNIFE